MPHNMAAFFWLKDFSATLREIYMYESLYQIVCAYILFQDLSLSCSPTYRNQTPESNVLRHSSPHNRFGTGSKSIEETSESNSLLDDMETFNINDKASDASQGTSVSNSSPESADTVIRRSYVTNEHGTSKASRSIAVSQIAQYRKSSN